MVRAQSSGTRAPTQSARTGQPRQVGDDERTTTRDGGPDQHLTSSPYREFDREHPRECWRQFRRKIWATIGSLSRGTEQKVRTPRRAPCWLFRRIEARPWPTGTVSGNSLLTSAHRWVRVSATRTTLLLPFGFAMENRKRRQSQAQRRERRDRRRGGALVPRRAAPDGQHVGLCLRVSASFKHQHG